MYFDFGTNLQTVVQTARIWGSRITSFLPSRFYPRASSLQRPNAGPSLTSSPRGKSCDTSSVPPRPRTGRQDREAELLLRASGDSTSTQPGRALGQRVGGPMVGGSPQRPPPQYIKQGRRES